MMGHNTQIMIDHFRDISGLYYALRVNIQSERFTLIRLNYKDCVKGKLLYSNQKYIKVTNPRRLIAV